MLRVITTSLLALSILVSCGPKNASVDFPSEDSEFIFGGSYDQLAQPQQELIDDWFERLGIMLDKEFQPAEEYNRLPLSSRTTFEAVTHALMTTELTDSESKHLGTGLDIIEHLETIRGHIPGVHRGYAVSNLCGPSTQCEADPGAEHSV
jgi:hypothetical protein